MKHIKEKDLAIIRTKVSEGIQNNRGAQLSPRAVQGLLQEFDEAMAENTKYKAEIAKLRTWTAKTVSELETMAHETEYSGVEAELKKLINSVPV